MLESTTNYHKKFGSSVWEQAKAGSTPVTRTMRSVLIGFEYPVTDTPHFYFLKNSYSDLCRGVADSYAFSCFHDDVSLGDFLAVWHFKGSDTIIVDNHLLIGHAILLFGMVHINVVNEFRHHAPGDFRYMSISPHYCQEVLHVHLLSLSLFQFQP